jgi:hypothetical protein
MQSNTVQRGVSERPVDDKSVVDWANQEASVLLRQIRSALNARIQAAGSAATDGAGTYAALWVSEAMPTDGTWLIEARAVGVTTSGTAQRAAYLLSAAFQSTAGVCAQVGATTTTGYESAAGCDARLTLDAAARTVTLEARDNATSPMNYTGVVWVQEALP